MRFAADTSVSVARSREEIEKIVMRYGATSFGTASDAGRTMVLFNKNNRRIRFILPLPNIESEDFTKKKRYNSIVETSPDERMKLWEQACRQKWRALLLCIKAKLEAVESGISEFESEFLANIVMADGKTVGERIVPMLPTIGDLKKLPPMLPSPAQAGA